MKKPGVPNFNVKKIVTTMVTRLKVNKINRLISGVSFHKHLALPIYLILFIPDLVFTLGLFTYTILENALLSIKFPGLGVDPTIFKNSYRFIVLKMTALPTQTQPNWIFKKNFGRLVWLMLILNVFIKFLASFNIWMRFPWPRSPIFWQWRGGTDSGGMDKGKGRH